MGKKITIALAGNPNSGKTTIFNNLTGSRQHVGNYPGVTVEKREGSLEYQGCQITVIDLPGTYSLCAYSPDEKVAQQVLVDETPDVVVNVVDAANLERNLFLTAQLKELGYPLLIVANMADMAEQEGIIIDYPLLETLLGAPIVKTVGHRNQGTGEILGQALNIVNHKSKIAGRPIVHKREIETEIQTLMRIIACGRKAPENPGLTRWRAIKLLENDPNVTAAMGRNPNWGRIKGQLDKSRRHLKNILGEEPESLIADGRYGFVRGACEEAVRYPAAGRTTVTEKIDMVLLNRVLGLPIFLGMMWLLFQLTFTFGAWPMEWIDTGFTRLGALLTRYMQPGLMQSLLVDGIIGGVGGVLVFLPNILLLFLGIALLEDTGYMARAAFLMDRVMHRVGLHGKSFVPLLIGFGCSIPAIMATRTLENEKDRLVTMLVAPLMSCGARLPVYALLIAAFFSKQAAGNVLFSVYLIGIILAIFMAKLFRRWLLPGLAEPFVMELPSYRWPTLKSILIHMWERAWLYVRKAGTLILSASLIVWALFTFPLTDSSGQEYANATEQMERSYAGRIGHRVEPLLSPLGFDWRTDIALVAGIAAKEVIVSTLGTLYSIDDERFSGEDQGVVQGFAEQARQKSGMTPLKAYVLMIFTLLYVPCLATIAIIKRESNSWKWPVFTVAYTVALAWAVSFAVYRGGLLLGFG